NEAREIFVDGTLSDKLDIVTFNSLENLQKEGSSLFVYKGDPADATAPEKVSVNQKALERPNVSTVVEMTKMIETMRTYEALQKMIQSFDETDSKIINEAARI
ncbi:MAG TPA: flagellar hook-basal body protein, partial [Desulfobacteraceae bacterium]|nr:flagellar hook-basal body protein [Desulfobacteraceae bacterium]